MSRSNIAELLNIPDVRLGDSVKPKQTVSDIKKYGKAINEASCEMLDAILGVDEAVQKVASAAAGVEIPPVQIPNPLADAVPVKNKGGRPKKQIVDVPSILHDGKIDDRALVIDRADEYIRFQAVEMYEDSKRMLEMIKSELITGAAPQMWQAYTGLLKAVGECHKRLIEVYEKIRQKYEFEAPMENAEELAKAEALVPKTLKASMDDVYDMIEASRGRNISSDEFAKIKTAAIDATCEVVE